jgi:pimeloyl-ACP methyl ester carboxylesterase
VTITSYTMPLTSPGTDSFEVTFTGYGTGRPVLLLHGGAGPQSVTGFAELLSRKNDFHVLVPVHPGFAGTTRPEDLAGIPSLAGFYQRLIDQLDLEDLTVMGNSIGGWIAAELALLRSPRISDLVLIDAVGIEVPGHPVADFFALTMDEVFSRSFHDPAPFRVDPAAMPPDARAIMAANRAALTAYAGQSMTDPSLASRLGALELTTLVLWGSSDRIADPDYGRAYAAAIPGARFELLRRTGHMPQQETPDQVLRSLEHLTSGSRPHVPLARPASGTAD